MITDKQTGGRPRALMVDDEGIETEAQFGVLKTMGCEGVSRQVRLGH